MRAHFCLVLVVGLCSAAIYRQPLPDKNSEERAPEDYGTSGKIECEDGMYFNEESGECEYCSECDQTGMYIRSACSSTKNTQCGWCASRQIVKNEDFERKCKNIGQPDENSIFFDEEELELEEIQPAKSIKRKIIEVLNEEVNGEEPSKKEKKTEESQELTSAEIDEEVRAKVIDESDIAKSEETQTENEDQIADTEPMRLIHSVKKTLVIKAPELYKREDDDELPPLPDDFSLEMSEEDDEEESEKQAYVWKDELKNKIQKMMLRKQKIEKDLQSGEIITIEDESEEGSVFEVKAPKSFDLDDEEAQEMARVSKEMIPLKIIVTGEASLLKDMPPLADGDSDEDDSSSSESSSSEEDDEEMEENGQISQEELNERSTRRMIRVCIMAVTFIIMCWIFLSYKEKRRRRIFVIPSLNTFTPEQEHMINRCNCKFEKSDGEHCYENKIAYV